MTEENSTPPNDLAMTDPMIEAPAATPKKAKVKPEEPKIEDAKPEEPTVEAPKAKRFAVSVSVTSPVRMVRSAGLLFSPTKEVLTEGNPALAELQANPWLTVEEVTEVTE